MTDDIQPGDANDTDRHIRIYLSCLNKLHQGLNNDGTKPIWLTQFTTICLMNIPEHMKNFGAAKHLWEGKTIGEGYLREVKPNIASLKRNWQSGVCERIWRQVGLEAVMRDADVHDDLQHKKTQNSSMFMNQLIH